MLTKLLPVKLTEEELTLKRDQLADKIYEGKSLDADLARVKADYKSRMEANKSEIEHLAGAIRDKEEMRNVQIIERRDDILRRIETVRIDTGEVVELRPMTISEMQGKLFEEEDKDEAMSKAREFASAEEMNDILALVPDSAEEVFNKWLDQGGNKADLFKIVPDLQARYDAWQKGDIETAIAETASVTDPQTGEQIPIVESPDEPVEDASEPSDTRRKGRAKVAQFPAQGEATA